MKRKYKTSKKARIKKRRANGLSAEERAIEELLKRHAVRAEYTKKGHIKFWLDNGKVWIKPKKHGGKEPRAFKNALAQLKRALGLQVPNPNLYMEAQKRYTQAIATRSPGVMRLTPYSAWNAYKLNPESRTALLRAYQAAKLAALDGDTRAMLVLRELEAMLAGERLNNGAWLNNGQKTLPKLPRRKLNGRRRVRKYRKRKS